MFGLGFLILIAFYVWFSVIIGKYIKKGFNSLALYYAVVVLIPTWFFVGHYVYPSYFKYKSLCESEATNHYYYDENVESSYNEEWLVPNRLVKRTDINVDKTENVVHELISFRFYTFGSKAKIMGLSTGAAPGFSCYGKSDLNYFISKHMKISPIRSQSIMRQAKISSMPEFEESGIIERGLSGDIVHCENKKVGEGFNETPGLGVYYFIKSKKIEKNQGIEKTICTDDNIYIVKTPRRGHEFFYVYTFDYNGLSIGNMKFPIPSRSWKGYPRKPLVYFSLSQSALTLGIEEFGKGVELGKIYFTLQLDEFNKSSNSDAVNSAGS